jgi:hydrogenase maturation protein HypF
LVKKLKSRAKLLVKGIVQGVGFRPFVYNLATTRSLNGWVLNSTEGVSIEVEGEKSLLEDFVHQIRQNPPPLATVDSVSVEYLPPDNFDTFVIRHSEGDKSKYMKISPDISTCADCLAELFDMQDRRYRYPFTNCTNCGPRFTIIKDIPYDRENTTMRRFRMCPLCQAEYDDPSDRRFHAQPNACPVCGPWVTLENVHGRIECDDPIKRAIELLCEGKIIAVKGLGGFHLACDAENDDAVRVLRERKRRTFKPFAIMSASIEKIRQFCSVSEEEEQVLQNIQRPIVLLRKLSSCSISKSVAPNNNYLGVMLPYTPLHYLLLDSPLLALVMTSGNISEEPIAIDNEEAKRRLAELADYFLTHNRDIRMRCDDSVVQVQQGNQTMLRRSRGYAPYPVDLDFSMKEILACGPELKNTFCLTKDNHAFLSHHIGDLQNIEAYNYFQDAIEYYKRLFRINPEIIAYDLHPDYLSTRYALGQEDARLVGVQHHHAHVASCMAENDLDQQVIGVACDGTGYGLDGKIWGCEFLVAGYRDFRRYARLRYIPLPGGDAAAKEPYRMAVSYLCSAFGEDFASIDTPLLSRLDAKRLAMLKRMIDRNINSPLTSSCGRLFDAVSSLLGVRDVITYEAQAAVELEMIAASDISESYSCRFEKSDNPAGADIPLTIDVREMFREIVFDMKHEVPKEVISAKFHNTVADFTIAICELIRDESDIDEVVLSGGTFQNRYLLTKVCAQLKSKGFIPYFHKRVPTNDGGVSLGQAIIANSRR